MDYMWTGNWVDLVILGVVAFFLLEGIFNRFLPSFFNLLGFVVTYAIALKYYSIAGGFLSGHFVLPHGIANAIGFFVTALIIEFIYNILISFIYASIPQSVKDSWFNRTFGFLPALGNSVILLAFVLTLIISLPTVPWLKKDILDSKLGSLLLLRAQGVEQAIDGVFGQAVNETLTFLTVHPEGNETVDLKFTTRQVAVDQKSEEIMLGKVNEERAKAGVQPLVLDPKLRDLARAYGKDMFARGFFSHYDPDGKSPFDRMKNAGIEYQAAGENLAYAPNVDVAHQGLMNSPGHRANILSKDFGHVGIGVIDGGVYGRMFVQEFTD